MTILSRGPKKKSTQSENKCFLIGRKLKIGPIDFTLEPIRQLGPKKSTQPEKSAFLLVTSSKLAPLISH